MASYDSTRGCYVVRVVYDGPGYAGKTTNLKQICEVTPVTRRTEMVTPAALKGRTMFFDWMEIDGPSMGSNTLKFQLITVPGQIERNYRRQPLVDMADVIVFVCDSSPDKVPDQVRTFARLRASMKLRDRPVPLVVQANKQDVAGALSLGRIRSKLGLAEETALVSASAASGQGVQETLSAAVRLGVRTLVGTPIEPLVAEFANADTLFDHVLTFEDAPRTGEPRDAEEVNLNVEEVTLPEADVAAHLAASSLDALEARARRAAQMPHEE